jgi:TrmH family RNA methyltransferase
LRLERQKELFSKRKKNQFLLCHIAKSTAYHTQDYTTPTVVVGTEATGLTQECDCDPKHYNPDAGEIDSMNVSVADINFEAKRQRGF